MTCAVLVSRKTHKTKQTNELTVRLSNPAAVEESGATNMSSQNTHSFSGEVNIQYNNIGDKQICSTYKYLCFKLRK